jgi:hypothetical protein
MPQLGLKLWSTNTGYAGACIEIYREGLFDYAELYVVHHSQNN